LTELKNTITRNIRKQNPRCVKCLALLQGLFLFSVLSIPRKSTQKEVVSAVKAESVVAKAAVNPKKMTDGISVK
jgi:hypothetical protein